MSELHGGDRLGGYIIERELGRGGMGAVFLARDERLGRPVALKVIVASLAADPGFRARFEREARIAATLEHPNVVPVYDIGEGDGRLFIAMRFIDGHDMASELRERGALPPRRVARLLSQVCSALDTAHRRGLVHRDVKPANVLLAGIEPDEHAYLTDFGLTRDAASESGLTGTGEWIGTIDYAAPEQIEVGRIDARTDVYAAACMAFHALTGRVPFSGGTAAKLHGHLSARPPSARSFAAELPPEVDAVLARGMAKDPAHRWASAGDLARELTAAVTGQPNVEPLRAVATGRALTGIPVVGEEAHGTTVAESVERRLPRPPSAAPRPAAGAAAQPGPRRSATTRALAVAVAALLLVGGAVAAIVLTSGGEDPARTASTEPSPTTLERTLTETVERTVRTPTSGTTRTSAATAQRLPRAFRSYTPPSGYYTADVPSGGGWELAGEEELNPGLLRTTIDGPSGATIWIDVTPAEPPGFDASRVAVRSDTIIAGGIREVVFTQGRNHCTTAVCALYQLVDGDRGVAVLGGPTSGARAAARRTATSMQLSFE